MKWIRHKSIPKKVYLCMWKAAFFYLPVDGQRLGISLALVCNFCEQRHEETFNHIFSPRSVACMNWKKASRFVGIYNMESESWWVKINRWFHNVKKYTLLGCLIGLVLVFITWRL